MHTGGREGRPPPASLRQETLREAQALSDTDAERRRGKKSTSKTVSSSHVRRASAVGLFGNGGVTRAASLLCTGTSTLSTSSVVAAAAAAGFSLINKSSSIAAGCVSSGSISHVHRHHQHRLQHQQEQQRQRQQQQQQRQQLRQLIFSTLDNMADEKTLDPPEGYTVLQEGKARILQRENDVFYNKAQVVNRDLSLSVMRQFQRVRAREHEAEKRTPKNKRGKGQMCATPRDSPILPHLMTPEEIEEMYKTQQMRDSADEDNAGATAAGGDGDGGGEGDGVGDGDAAAGAGAGTAAEDGDAAREKPPLKPLRILEGMAASGLRAIRYARELDEVGCVVANDLDPTAIDAIKRNKEFNAGHSADAAARMEKVVCAGTDVRMLMMQHEKMFDAVDLDPYGTPSTLLDGAVQTVADGGLLLITATDMAVLCGNNGEVCWTKYGSYPLRAKYCHEQALRILLGSINTAATRYKRHIVPVLSVSVDFYIRCFVRVYTSAKEAKMAPTKVSYCYQCVGCDTYAMQPVGRIATRGNSTKFQPGRGPVVPESCPNCGWHFNLGGPFWSEPIHDQAWVSEIKKQVEDNKATYPGYDKIHALLTTVSEELPDCPLHYDIHSMSQCLKATPPPMALFRSAVINAGYRVSPAHCNPLAVKTDAPSEVLWDILRCWVKEHPVKEQKEKTPGGVILEKEPAVVANWTRVNGAFTKAQREGVTRFPNNPEENWGPKMRAGRPMPGGGEEKHGATKKQRTQ